MGIIAHVSQRRKYQGLTIVGSVDVAPSTIYDEIKAALRDYYQRKNLECLLEEFAPETRRTEFQVYDSPPGGVRIIRGDSHVIDNGTIFRYYVFFEQGAGKDRYLFFEYVQRERGWPHWP